MIYTVIALLILMFLIWFTVRDSKISPKIAWKGNLFLTCIGILLYIAVFLFLILQLSQDTMDADYAAWAWNAVFVFLELSLVPLAIFLFITCFSALSAIWDKKYRSKNARITRYSCSLCCSAAMLLLAPYYSFMTENTQVPLEICILLLGIADALILRCMFLLERRDLCR